MQVTLNLVRDLLLANDNFLILTHKNPDGDTLGSALALCLALNDAGKCAYILENEGTTDRFIARISPLHAPRDFTPDFVISVDTAASDMLSKNSSHYADRVDLAIDHHISHKEYAKNTLVCGDSAACGEIIWEIILSLGTTVTDKIAEAIYIAISTDTSCFLNANTTAKTHEIAAKLYSFDVDFSALHREFFITKTRARLAIEANLIANMNFYFDGAVAIMRLDNQMIASAGATEDDLDNISALARSVEGVELGILVREREEGISKISMRSSERVNASEICSFFGGGGHIRAAGGTIESAPCEAEAKIVEHLCAIFNSEKK